MHKHGVSMTEFSGLMVLWYRSISQWADKVLRLTDGKGADLVLETGGTATFP